MSIPRKVLYQIARTHLLSELRWIVFTSLIILMLIHHPKIRNCKQKTPPQNLWFFPSISCLLWYSMIRYPMILDDTLCHDMRWYKYKISGLNLNKIRNMKVGHKKLFREVLDRQNSSVAWTLSDCYHISFHFVAYPSSHHQKLTSNIKSWQVTSEAVE